MMSCNSITTFGECLHLVYPNEVEIKNTVEMKKFASYLDLSLIFTQTEWK